MSGPGTLQISGFFLLIQQIFMNLLGLDIKPHAGMTKNGQIHFNLSSV